MIILLVMLCVIALPFVIALFTSKHFRLEREVVINKPKQVVFDYLKYLKNHDNFTVWASTDPNMKREYHGTDGTVGFSSAWESDHKQVGHGKQIITAIKDGERLDMQVHFLKPWDNVANAYFKIESAGDNQTKVKWGINNDIKYPMKVMSLFMNMKKMISKDFDKGLNKLKVGMEK